MTNTHDGRTIKQEWQDAKFYDEEFWPNGVKRDRKRTVNPMNGCLMPFTESVEHYLNNHPEMIDVVCRPKATDDDEIL